MNSTIIFEIRKCQKATHEFWNMQYFRIEVETKFEKILHCGFLLFFSLFLRNLDLDLDFYIIF